MQPAAAVAWSSRSALLDRLNDDLDAPVVLTTGRRTVVRHRAALPDAGRRDDLARDAARDEVVTHGLCAPLRKLDVRRLGALRIGVPLDDHLVVGLVLQRFGHLVELLARTRKEVPLGGREEDGARQRDDR